MRHGSLFSGIGGFDLAAEWMGWENVFHCEWNDFGKQVLKHYWPKAKSYDDITTTDFNIHRGGIDILTGGFPCQPYSAAGKRLGKEDDRHLWPEMLRAIREIQPKWIVGENVLGLVNWNGGLVFDEVQADLEAEGYEVQPYVLPAVSVNAPHRRDRIWFVAHSSSSNDRRNSGEILRITPDSNSTMRERGQERGQAQGGSESHKEQFRGCDQFFRTDFTEFPSKPPLCNGNDGIPSQLDGITFSKWRNESIKAGGNAIVPQVVHQIFKTIQKYEEL